MKRLHRLNYFDLLTGVSLGLLTILILLFFFLESPDYTRPMSVKVQILDKQGVILSEVEVGEAVYFNSLRNPVEITEVTSNGEYLFVTVRDTGDIVKGIKVFNGQAVRINQKAELRGAFFAQGIITDIVYED